MSLVYLYCLLPGEAQVALDGIEGMETGSTVSALAVHWLQAVVSEVGEEFGEAQLNARIRDLDWVSPRAVRHHEVVDGVYAQCKELLPMSFGAIFRSEETLRQRLGEQQTELMAALDRLRGREQWDLKLSREQAVFDAALAGESADLQAAQTELASKPPGTRFLLEKKIQTLRARESQRVAAVVRKDVHDALSARAVEAHRDQLVTPAGPQNVQLELKSAYLVEEAAADGLKLAIEALSSKYASLGYRFDLSGPWPAFSFAGGVQGALA
jgi:hypothetical protein